MDTAYFQLSEEIKYTELNDANLIILTLIGNNFPMIFQKSRMRTKKIFIFDNIHLNKYGHNVYSDYISKNFIVIKRLTFINVIFHKF